MHRIERSLVVLSLLAPGLLSAPAAAVPALTAFDPPALQALAAEALERNPAVARARHRAAAAAARAPQVRALPDPVASLDVFLLQPETRVGPQRFRLAVEQRFPGFGKLALREQAAVLEAAAAEAEVEAVRLDVLTQTRRLVYELAFVEAQRGIAEAERSSLVRYEQVSRGRYETGSGLQQEPLRIQAQITRIDTRLLEIAERRASLLAEVNSLRDRPAAEPLKIPAVPEPQRPWLDRALLRQLAEKHRPELAAEDARIAARETMVRLAEKASLPGFTVGLAFTEVGSREDGPGRLAPPPDNGDDILALTGSVNLPVWRRKTLAGLEEALAQRSAEQEGTRGTLATIERSIGDLTARLPLLYNHWKLLDGVLQVQARESLRSAETAYSTGQLNAVDLLDSEVVLFEVRIAVERTRTDFAIARLQLERAVGIPVPLETVPLETVPLEGVEHE